jgi:hypothetical protein
MKKQILCSHWFPALLVILLPRLATAAWPPDALRICPVASTQAGSEVVSDGAGGAFVTWRDGRGGSYEVYVQHVLACGVTDPVWPPEGRALSTAAGADHIAPWPNAIVADGAGGAIVAWQDYRSSTNFDIYAQKISAAGAVEWTTNGVAVCTASGYQGYPSIVCDSAGGAIVAWGGFGGVYAQRISTDGAVQWVGNGVALCTAGGGQGGPRIVSDGAGGAVVTWEDWRSGDKDIYAQRVNASGTPEWPPNGVALCTASGHQEDPRIVSDGAGGAIVTWMDPRGGTYRDIYAQRVLASGVVDPAWPVNGRALCTDAADQNTPAIASDGAGGAIVTWQDYRGMHWHIYAQHVLASGIVNPAWPVDGRALCTDPAGQDHPAIASDGAGGAIVAWNDERGGYPDHGGTYAQRVRASGVVDPAWPANGRALRTSLYDSSELRVAADGAGGAIVTWGFGLLFAQRIRADGAIGMLENPHITSVSDVANDQGGHVLVTWKPSSLDCDSLWGISYYWVYQRDAGVWNAIATVTAQVATSYSLLVHTFSDSMPGSALPWRVFRVDALAETETFSSMPDSGYSVDNLWPAMPAPFTGEYSGGSTALHWNPNAEPDLAGYQLYRGSSPDFVPGPGCLVVSKSDTGYVDAAGSPFYYKLAAVDLHGNLSAFAFLLPSGTAEVPGEASLTFALDPVRPSPSRGGALTVHFTLPTAAPARLELLDVAGRRIASSEVGSLGAGRHALDLSEGRLLAPGLYLVRLTQGANMRVTRAAVLK